MRPGYALAALAIFAIEVLIALYLNDAIVRPYVGDALAVVLVYAGLRALTRLGVRTAIAVALGVAAIVEFGQLIGILGLLGLAANATARTVFGSGFDPKDFAAYGLGGLAAAIFEWARGPHGLKLR